MVLKSSLHTSPLGGIQQASAPKTAAKSVFVWG